jgi:hypothetical protein
VHFPLDRFFSLDYIAPSDSGIVIRPAGGPLTPGTPPSRLTQPVGLHRDIEALSLLVAGAPSVMRRTFIPWALLQAAISERE